MRDHLGRMERLHSHRLDDGSTIFLPAALNQGDFVAVMLSPDHKGRARGGVVGQVVDSKAPPPAIPLADAFAMVSRAMLGPECKGVLRRDNGEIIVGLDSRRYAELKEALGYGHTALPLDPEEMFAHAGFVFCIAASHAWQRGRDPGQPLS